jgi:hypothetical protein
MQLRDVDGQESTRVAVQVSIGQRSAIYPAFRSLFPNQVIRADDLARAMVDVAISDTSERQGSVFENRDIRAMVAGSK